MVLGIHGGHKSVCRQKQLRGAPHIKMVAYAKKMNEIPFDFWMELLLHCIFVFHRQNVNAHMDIV